MYTNMALWSEVCRRALTGELSKRQACQQYELHWDTLQKIFQHSEPLGYRKETPRRKTALGPFVTMIHQILEADKQAPKKQQYPTHPSMSTTISLCRQPPF